MALRFAKKHRKTNLLQTLPFLSRPYISFAFSGKSHINKGQIKIRDGWAEVRISFCIFLWQMWDSSKSWEFNNLPVEESCVGPEKESRDRLGRRTMAAEGLEGATPPVRWHKSLFTSAGSRDSETWELEEFEHGQGTSLGLAGWPAWQTTWYKNCMEEPYTHFQAGLESGPLHALQGPAPLQPELPVHAVHLTQPQHLTTPPHTMLCSGSSAW